MMTSWDSRGRPRQFRLAWLLLAAFALISAGVALLRLLPAPYLTTAGHPTSKHRRYSRNSAD